MTRRQLKDDDGDDTRKCFAIPSLWIFAEKQFKLLVRVKFMSGTITIEAKFDAFSSRQVNEMCENSRLRVVTARLPGTYQSKKV